VNLAIRHPEVCRAIVSAGTGGGTTSREQFERDVLEVAKRLEEVGWENMADTYARGPARLEFIRKDPHGWQEFHDLLATHSAQGSAHIFRGVVLKRPTIFELEAELAQLQVPTLVITGDEDESTIDPSLFMKSKIPNSGLAIFPQTGHTMNLEEPEMFNRTVQDFFTAVETGAWAPRPEVSASYLPPDMRP
jgi:pimeloyl-ACP methyl ester carboxylesterase